MRAAAPIPAQAFAGPARVRTGAVMAWAVAAVALAVGLGTTLVLARHRGGLSQLFADEDAPRNDPAAASVAPEATRREAKPATSCPDEMRLVEAGANPGVCIDQGEFPGLRQIPRTQVALAEARAACQQRGARLCTVAEWRGSCRGPHNWRHPYGARGELDRCNGASPSGAVQDLSRSGARDRCVTDSGVFDLEGNVAEWVEEGVALGGDSATRSPSCDARLRLEPTARTPTVGFRCCLDLAPR
ncbi:MAG: SUMF1/EgtB/PvdO family nonheme iron enzyme [Nannocystaceae bacterium]